MLFAGRKNEQTKNKIGLQGNGLDGKKDRMCGKAEAAVNPESACKSSQRCVYVHECDFWLSQLKLTLAGSPKAISQSHSCPFPASLHTDKKEAADAQM